MIITVADQDKNLCRYARYAETPPYASGWQTFSYGKLGELTENIRTFAPPFENQTYTFNMYFEYDSWNRMQLMTYPDGEEVSYDYNKGGMLERITGEKSGEHNDYVNHIEYNPFEQKEAVYYGNGAVTSYSYDVLRRLSHLLSVCADSVMQDIDYGYDSVSNIRVIANNANMLSSGLGGTYRSDYTYDNLYRLTYAAGNWHGNNTLYDETSMEYEKNGRISRKVLYADTWLNGVYAMDNYNNEYHYTNTAQPNTLTFINNSTYQNFAWDVKGNMIYHMNYGVPMKRYLCWDEQNRLLGVKDDQQRLSYYQYDANGDRTYKFTGEYAAQNQSGQWHYYYLLNCPTLYASPYLVTNKKGYTKHYYAENERIASRIGGGGLYDLHKGFENYPDMVGKHKESSAKLFYKVMECLDADALPQEDALKYLYEWQEVVEDEKDCYWYHPDHLGSSSWITYTDSSAVQHLYYLPWGEDFVDQKSSGFDGVRFTFSAKEKDSETGLSYFGSRYYSSDLSIWLSVDPMSGKYPHQSNYVYCSNNPIKVVDPNGEDEWEVNQSGYIRHIQNNKPDRLYAVYGYGKESWGKRKSDVEPLDVDKSIMNTMDNRDKYTTFSTQNNRAKMDELFNFFADNTDVEWTQLSMHDFDGNNYDYLSTSHDNINSDLPSLYKSMVHANAKRGTLDTFKHSHPNHYTGFKYYYKIIYPYTSHIPSGGDMETKQNILEECGSGKFQPLFILRNGGRSNGY